jgi:cytochrome c oxidase cbb3-type subunit I/II
MLLRVVGGGLYLVGFILLAYNIFKSIKGAQAVNGTMEVYTEEYTAEEKLTVKRSYLNAPVVYTTLGTVAACVWMFTTGWLNLLALFATVMTVLMAAPSGASGMTSCS